MTVRELIAELEKMPQDLPVFRYANWECEEVNEDSSTPESDDGNPCVTLY
jgi:hypothetical protein